MEQQQGRTWLCSVVFIDIAGYTEHSVTGQINLKGRLQSLIEQIITVTPESERVIVDTGDGAALCYLGDPEQALLSAVRLREALMHKADSQGEPFKVRIGINLGPVRLHRSLAGQLNPLGDGINNAQRVMGFAEPNQILVSRSFYDVIACLSQEYAQLFVYLGIKEDKHHKGHPVYEVRLAGRTREPVTEQTTRFIAEQARTERLRNPAPDWEPAVLQRAELALAGFVGPVARVLVKKAACYAKDANGLYKLLAEALPPDEREQLYGVLGVESAAAPAPAAPAPVGVGPASPAPLAPEELRAAEAHLAGYIGPLAKIIVRRAAQTTSDRARFYEALAQELATPAEREAFLSAIQPPEPAG